MWLSQVVASATDTALGHKTRELQSEASWPAQLRAPCRRPVVKPVEVYAQKQLLNCLEALGLAL